MKHGKPLVFGHDDNGRRHFLDGRGVGCGTHLELRGVKWERDDDGEHQVPSDEWIGVRYEASLFRGAECVVTLYAELGGHTATLEHWESMRFRWPTD